MYMKNQKTAVKTATMSRVLPLAALGIAGALYASSVNRRRKTAAVSHTKLLERIEHKPTSITFAWPAQGQYRVYRDQTLIYTGSAAVITDQNLVPGTQYTYSIEKMDEQGQIIELMKVQTVTAVENKEKENILQDLIMTTVVTHGQISLEWEPVEGISKYTLLRNGVLLMTTDQCSYTDINLKQDEEYTYTITAERPLQRSDQMKWEIKSVVANAVGAIKKDSSTDLAAKEEFSISKKVGPINKLLVPAEDKTNFTREGLMQFRYTTFLTEGWLQNPNAASPDHYFKGDDRGFSPDSDRFRTRADVFIDSENPSALLSKEVGKTEAFSRNEEFIDEAKASDESIELEKVMTDDEKVIFHLHHSVSNPLVMSPAIDYHVCGTFFKNGQFDLVGIHDQAPHHEAYIKDAGTDDWQPILQTKSKGLEMMANPMANHYWRYSTFTK
jgi:hypothetical protein